MPILKFCYSAILDAATMPPAALSTAPAPESSVPSTSTALTPWSLAKKAKLCSVKANMITRAITTHIIDDLRPFSTIESKSFRHILNVAEPRYRFPSRSTLAGTLIPSLYDEEKANLLKDLNAATWVALTTDGWTSRATESFLTVTAHYLKDWALTSKVLQTQHFTESHTGENIAAELQSAIEKWNIQGKVKVITVDNAANMDVAVKSLGAVKMGCFAHTLNLASNKTLQVKELGKLRGKIQSIVSFFHKSTSASELLLKNQKGLALPEHKLITECRTRWNSMHDMFERFLEQRPAIIATLSSPTIRKRQGENFELSKEERKKVEDYVTVMKIMVTATKALSEESTPTAGIVLPMHDTLLRKFSPLDTDSSFVTEIKNAVHKNLASRYKDPELNKFLQEAAAMDPRMQHKPVIKEDVWARLAEAAAKNSPTGLDAELQDDDKEPSALTSVQDPDCEEPPKKKSLLDDIFDDEIIIEKEEPPLPPLERAKMEIIAYRQLPGENMKRKPLHFWKEKADDFPLLASLAGLYLCVQASSVASERIFSTAGDIVTATRACLDPENVDRLIFLKKNMSK